MRGFRPNLSEPYLNRLALRRLRSFGSFFIAKITLAIPVNKVPVATIKSAISDIFISFLLSDYIISRFTVIVNTFYQIFIKNFFRVKKKALPAVKLVGFLCIKKQIGLSFYIFSGFSDPLL